MLIFKDYGLKEIKEIFKPYFINEDVFSCDYTLGEKFMWNKFFKSSYALVNNTLTFKEMYGENNYAFYYPMGEDIEHMFSLIKEYELASNKKRLEFCSVDEKHLLDLKNRFPHNDYYYDDDWSDYLYLNKNFQTFSGNLYANKRHHVKQFIKEYKEAIFKKYTNEDKSIFLDFIDEFNKSKIVTSKEAINEINESKELIKHFDELGFDCFYIEYNNKVIALSICEVINDCIYDHIEKALREYNSIYPYFVNKIALYYQNITYFNREDDSGDPGLRFSKLDYHPYKMINKYMFYVRNNLDLLNDIPTIQIDNNISLTKLLVKDKLDYFNLYIDEELNKYWGYDYKIDLKDNKLDPDYFYNMVNDDFNNKEWFSFIIKYNDLLIGEITLGELNNLNECSIGYRLIKKYQHLGICYKSMIILIDYLKNNIGLKALNAKAYKENTPSINLLNKLNFKCINNDDTFNYYRLELNN